MGCVPSAMSAREKRKAAVQPLPSPKVLRGDLLSRAEARQRREKSIMDHHAKTKRMAETMAYNTMAEKEKLSTSTEQSYRSGRGFLVTSPGDINATEEGSSLVTIESGKPVVSVQIVAPIGNSTDATDTTATHPSCDAQEEEPIHQQEGVPVKGQGSDGDPQASLQPDPAQRPADEDRRETEVQASSSGKDSSVELNQAKGHEGEGRETQGQEAEACPADGGNELSSRKPVKVRFVCDGDGSVLPAKDGAIGSMTPASRDSQQAG